MPVCHFNLTKPKETIKLNSVLTAQKFRLVKAVVSYRHSLIASDGLIGHLEILVNGLMGNEILSSKSNGRIPIPVHKHYNVDQILTFEMDFNLLFQAEHIPMNFDIETFGYFESSSKTAIENLSEGNIQPLSKGNGNRFASTPGFGMPVSIDLYFDYETNHTYF